MGSFSVATRIGIVDKAPLQYRLDDIAHRVMYDAVAERRCFNETLFGIVDNKLPVSAMPVGLVGEIPAQSNQILFKPIAELQNGTAIAFCSAGIAIGSMKIFKIDDVCE